MANEATGQMAPEDWKRATDALVALSQKAQEHLDPPKANVLRQTPER